MTQEQRTIPIVGLPEAGIGDFSISSVTTNYNIRARDIMPYSPATLAESRHAIDTSADYRQSLKDEAKFHWVNTWLLDGKYQIVNPDAVVKVRGIYQPIGGRKERVELPRTEGNRNWVTEYDRTGWPSRLGTREEAENVFGEDASRFWYNSHGLRAVLVGPHWGLVSFGPVDVSAGYDPGGRSPIVGVRSANRHEPLQSDARSASMQGNGESRLIRVSEEEYKQYLEWRESQQDTTDKATS